MNIHYERPMFYAEDIAILAQEYYGLPENIQVMALPGEKDLNFRLSTSSAEQDEQYVLKIAHAEESSQVLAMQHAALQHLAQRLPALQLQRVVAAKDGRDLMPINDRQGCPHLMRLLTYLPGQVWAKANPHTPDRLQALGEVLGAVDAALLDFVHPAAQRSLKWDLAQSQWAQDYTRHISSARRKLLVQRHFARYRAQIQPALVHLRHSVIYNDANDYNILVSPRLTPDVLASTSYAIALIDFGDMLHTATICDLAIACAYAMLDMPDPLAAAADVVRGYHHALPLQEEELALLFPLILTRLCVSVTNSAYQQTIEPDNTYLTISERSAWELLEKLEQINLNLAHYTLRAACSYPAVPHSPLLVEWLQEHADEIGNIVLPDLRTAPYIYTDWSVGSLELTNPDDYGDPKKFTRQIWNRMDEAGVQIAIGGYNHARPVYGGDAFRIPSNNGYEWRTVHIGLDVFMDAETPILAPLDGEIHSFANNTAQYDYGPCIVLKHEIKIEKSKFKIQNDADTDVEPFLNSEFVILNFYTLYGHLTEDSLSGLSVGKKLKKGEQIGKMGNYPINGNWPPHLHLQIITDMLDFRGDFNGSCRPSQRDVWLSISPDANLIARIPFAAHSLPLFAFNSSAVSSGQWAETDILSKRRELLGPNLSISYRKKLHIVRGWKQWLYDAEGQRYLDAVNNVPHVGHSHPRVVRAGQAQMAVLNTNTRYLHENLVRYADRLTQTLPAPLRVCYFVNSGSEANELALRLARIHTRQKDMLVVDVGYHGNTSSVVDISSYKFDHKGGLGAPDWVHKLAMPDVYRGAYPANDPQAGYKYAQSAAIAIQQLRSLPPHYQPAQADVRYATERGLAGFICESVLSCGGQIVLPPGYLCEMYRQVHATGGVCIADEVQTGFGRVGSHFWAFQTQGDDIVPDIVTMGKPAGNGHPLGIVVTTPEIAASFNNGLEYFNTFGGNPVSCAIGLAVLDVIRDEGLQANALDTGNYLMDGLRGLMADHPIMGDVRGLGLFSGFELVRERAGKAPATAQASQIVNRMKDHGILLSTDGPYENVIKIKPPLVFDRRNADFVIAMLDKVLREDDIRLS